MKKLFGIILTAVLAVVLSVAVFATPSMEVFTAGHTDLHELEEGDTFDVYIVVTPFNKIGNSANANYVYRVPEDTNQGKVPAAASNKLTHMKYVLTWDKTSLEVANVSMYTGNPSTTDQDAGNGYKFAYLAKTAQTTAAGVQHATVSGVGSGDRNTGVLSIDFGDTATGGFLIRNEATVPNGAVAVVTFRVVSGARGGASNVTLTNTYKYDGTEKRVNASPVGVTVLAGCEHANKIALTPDELAVAGLENTTVTCMYEGVTWYNCVDCNKVISITTNKLPHDYSVEKYLIGNEPTCMTAGKKAMYCSTEGCTEYDASTVVSVDALGHDFADDNYAYLAPTCTEDGYELYYCTRCNYLSPDKVTVVAYKYVNGKFYTITGTEIAIPDGVKLEALGHNWVFSRTEGDVSYYACARNCGVAEKAIGFADAVRYVSTNGTGDGLSATTPTTLKKAFEDFESIPDGVECTIYLVGTVTLSPNKVSSNNTFIKSFEEPKHDAHVTITTAPGEPKATMFFPFSSVSQYYLYGPTTFDNIIISSDAAGTTSGTSASITIFARGFDIEMTENVEMASTAATPTIPYSKTNGSFEYAANLHLNIPACKVYLCGGFCPDGFYDGVNSDSEYTTNMVVNGGYYWAVVGATRSVMNVYNCEVNITVGGNAVIGQLVSINTTSGVQVDGSVANIHYYGGTIALVNRSEYPERDDYSYTVNHFFHNGCGSMAVGDFMMGTKHYKNVNCYYSVNDAASPSAADYGLAFVKKGEQYGAQYNEISENLTFPEWCMAYGGGHDFVGGKCTFCGIAPCAAHTPKTVVDSVANCVQTGVTRVVCAVCFEELDRTVYPINDDHDYEWQTTKSPLECKCLLCGDISYTYSGDTSKIYVSDNGFADGGFSADYPLNNFEIAQKIAALCETDPTIYIVDSITVEGNWSGSTHTVYAEHPHTNTITICGYNSLGVIKFPSLPDESGRVLYAMNGDVKFENVEFSNWNAVDGVTKSNGKTYIVAQHNHLTFGENVTTDFMRNENSNKATCSMTVIGGCYYYEYHADGTHITSANCQKTDSHVTFYSGAFYNFVGGSIGGACALADGTVCVDILGDVSFRDYFVMGSFERNIGDAVITVDGNLSIGGTNGFFSLGGSNKTSQPFDCGRAEDVTVKIYSGSIIADNFKASAGEVYSSPLGAPRYDANGKYGADANHDITMLLDSLTICYDAENASAVALTNLFKSAYAAYDGINRCELSCQPLNGVVPETPVSPESCTHTFEVLGKYQGKTVSKCTLCGAMAITMRDKGDADCDGEVTVRDVARMLQFICDWDVDLDFEVADINGDGVITVRDAAQVLQALAGWYVDLSGSDEIYDKNVYGLNLSDGTSYPIMNGAVQATDADGNPLYAHEYTRYVDLLNYVEGINAAECFVMVTTNPSALAGKMYESIEGALCYDPINNSVRLTTFAEAFVENGDYRYGGFSWLAAKDRISFSTHAKDENGDGIISENEKAQSYYANADSDVEYRTLNSLKVTFIDCDEGILYGRLSGLKDKFSFKDAYVFYRDDESNRLYYEAVELTDRTAGEGYPAGTFPMKRHMYNGNDHTLARRGIYRLSGSKYGLIGSQSFYRWNGWGDYLIPAKDANGDTVWSYNGSVRVNVTYYAYIKYDEENKAVDAVVVRVGKAAGIVGANENTPVFASAPTASGYTAVN